MGLFETHPAAAPAHGDGGLFSDPPLDPFYWTTLDVNGDGHGDGPASLHDTDEKPSRWRCVFHVPELLSSSGHIVAAKSKSAARRIGGLFDGFRNASAATLVASLPSTTSQTAVNDDDQQRYFQHAPHACEPHSRDEKQLKQKKNRIRRPDFLTAWRRPAFVEGLTVRLAPIRSSYRAILWSLLMALPVVTVGYSQGLIVSLLAQPQFQERFAADEEDFGAAWMLAVQVCSVGSAMLGNMLVG
ncbi:hypothetical protein SPI_02390 [Niveomyces insectorum RCEF 264]|uniref:Uncharacterized protein n=1 Tax=Niveomyces insectorum RCEF 264 TaxID=1081102 RepID=A0A167XZ17_9HYPO|nr:hypothetical protein SPI_02390 [Niveomyces insectorum RCEF 264]